MQRFPIRIRWDTSPTNTASNETDLALMCTESPEQETHMTLRLSKNRIYGPSCKIHKARTSSDEANKAKRSLEVTEQKEKGTYEKA